MLDQLLCQDTDEMGAADPGSTSPIPNNGKSSLTCSVTSTIRERGRWAERRAQKSGTLPPTDCLSLVPIARSQLWMSWNMSMRHRGAKSR